MVIAPVMELDADVLERLEEYVAELAGDFGVITRRYWAGVYVQGLILDGERKSIQPLAQRVTVPGWHGDTMQALQQFVTDSGWDELAVLRTYRRRLAASIADPAGVIVIDDTGFAKKGRHSVGVARQYSGTLGKTDNCQVAVSLHYAAPQGDYPLALRLYLPDAGIVMSSREAADFRDGLVPLGITHTSAGSHTEPGGYNDPGAAEGQFEVNDTRTAAEVSSALAARGFDVVWKDWDPAMRGAAVTG